MFESIKKALSKTAGKISDGIANIFKDQKLDDETLEALERQLITSDIGVNKTKEILDSIKNAPKESTLQDIKIMVRDKILASLEKHAKNIQINEHPLICILSGVNGNGKTTTIGKLANFYKTLGYKVRVAACDTYRAAAIEQLQSWCDIVGVPLTSGAQNSDPASVAYRAVSEAIKNSEDILFIDTAGRLHNRDDLMGELEKISRVIKKLIPNAPHESFLVLDATTGQIAVQQAKIFLARASLTGVIITKLDGTAKGGIAVNIAEDFNLPIVFLSYGEDIKSIKPFDPLEYTNSLLNLD